MRNSVKWLGFIAFVAVIGFSMVSCDLFGSDDSDYEKLNGAWEYVDGFLDSGYVVTFTDDVGVFTEIKPDTSWQIVLNNGSISIGSPVFTNIKVLGDRSDLQWTCKKLSINPDYSTRWHECTLYITGQTLHAHHSSMPRPSSFTKK